MKNPTAFNSLSFRAKLLWMVGVLSLSSILLMGVLALQSRKSLREGKENHVTVASETLIDAIDRNLFERYGDVQAYAVSESARSGSPERITDFMNDMMGIYSPVYDLMIVTNARGRVVAVNTVDKNGQRIDSAWLIGKDYSGAAWFRAAINGKIKAGNAFVEDLHVDSDVARVYGEGGKVMNFTSPIRDKETGQIVGVWSNRMSWTDVVESIAKQKAEEAKDEHTVVSFPYLLDAKGNYLIHPQGAEYELKKARDGFAELKSASKGEVVVTQQDVAYPAFTGRVAEAISFSKGFASYPSQGWAAVMQIPATDARNTFNSALIAFAVTLILLCNGFGYWLVSRIAGVFETVIERLRSESGRVNTAATEITNASVNLAQASTEQASALQETAASIEEMNAMIKKNSDNAVRSREVSSQSQHVATKGKAAVEQMAQAIEEINQSNNRIVHKIDESNREITEIIGVITEIGNKTKVINDIVFQTKMLSFNASVEAARAGEHGKGFAVVAEEVGNLAQMSGNAAKEISAMLQTSIKRVEAIVAQTKSSVEGIVAEGKEKVAAGTAIAKQCGEVLDEVVRNVSEVDTMISEIASASREQTQGVSEISKAMNQLDEVTHENAVTSQQTAGLASHLTGQAGTLLQVVATLAENVRGAGATHAAPSAAAHAEQSAAAQASHAAPAPAHAPAHATAHAPASNVVRFDESRAHRHEEPAYKKASGSSVVPSEDDPRFKEI